jgi:hypothetical protein
VLGVATPSPDPGAGLRCCIIEQPAHLLGAETSDAAGGGTPSHGSDQVVRFFHAGAQPSSWPAKRCRNPAPQRARNVCR